MTFDRLHTPNAPRYRAIDANPVQSLGTVTFHACPAWTFTLIPGTFWVLGRDHVTLEQVLQPKPHLAPTLQCACKLQDLPADGRVPLLLLAQHTPDRCTEQPVAVICALDRWGLQHGDLHATPDDTCETCILCQRVLSPPTSTHPPTTVGRRLCLDTKEIRALDGSTTYWHCLSEAVSAFPLLWATQDKNGSTIATTSERLLQDMSALLEATDSWHPGSTTLWVDPAFTVVVREYLKERFGLHDVLRRTRESHVPSAEGIFSHFGSLLRRLHDRYPDTTERWVVAQVVIANTPRPGLSTKAHPVTPAFVLLGRAYLPPTCPLMPAQLAQLCLDTHDPLQTHRRRALEHTLDKLGTFAADRNIRYGMGKTPRVGDRVAILRPERERHKSLPPRVPGTILQQLPHGQWLTQEEASGRATCLLGWQLKLLHRPFPENAEITYDPLPVPEPEPAERDDDTITGPPPDPAPHTDTGRIPASPDRAWVTFRTRPNEPSSWVNHAIHLPTNRYLCNARTGRKAGRQPTPQPGVPNCPSCAAATASASPPALGALPPLPPPPSTPTSPGWWARLVPDVKRLWTRWTSGPPLPEPPYSPSPRSMLTFATPDSPAADAPPSSSQPPDAAAATPREGRDPARGKTTDDDLAHAPPPPAPPSKGELQPTPPSTPPPLANTRPRRAGAGQGTRSYQSYDGSTRVLIPADADLPLAAFSSPRDALAQLGIGGKFDMVTDSPISYQQLLDEVAASNHCLIDLADAIRKGIEAWTGDPACTPLPDQPAKDFARTVSAGWAISRKNGHYKARLVCRDLRPKGPEGPEAPAVETQGALLWVIHVQLAVTLAAALSLPRPAFTPNHATTMKQLADAKYLKTDPANLAPMQHHTLPFLLIHCDAKDSFMKIPPSIADEVRGATPLVMRMPKAVATFAGIDPFWDITHKCGWGLRTSSRALQLFYSRALLALDWVNHPDAAAHFYLFPKVLTPARRKRLALTGEWTVPLLATVAIHGDDIQFFGWPPLLLEFLDKLALTPGIPGELLLEVRVCWPDAPAIFCGRQYTPSPGWDFITCTTPLPDDPQALTLSTDLDNLRQVTGQWLWLADPVSHAHVMAIPRHLSDVHDVVGLWNDITATITQGTTTLPWVLYPLPLGGRWYHTAFVDSSDNTDSLGHAAWFGLFQLQAESDPNHCLTYRTRGLRHTRAVRTVTTGEAFALEYACGDSLFTRECLSILLTETGTNCSLHVVNDNDANIKALAPLHPITSMSPRDRCLRLIREYLHPGGGIDTITHQSGDAIPVDPGTKPWANVSPLSLVLLITSQLGIPVPRALRTIRDSPDPAAGLASFPQFPSFLFPHDSSDSGQGP
ncbi:MAG: hypothetical protein A3G29_09145 [Burkholderiales bacterium RIFCSPLOWO2_12_FULL_64_99]|nr:MAG: hypothetical protein A3G29_09145 [Burkholderiales bacterium RIFCSPLOWO2_12_FULL_64_99]